MMVSVSALARSMPRSGSTSAGLARAVWMPSSFRAPARARAVAGTRGTGPVMRCPCGQRARAVRRRVVGVFPVLAGGARVAFRIRS